MTRRRPNGEGSIFPYRNGYAAYVWVTTPAGERKRRWVYGKTREQVHEKYTEALHEAANGPMQTTTPTVEQYITYRLSCLAAEFDWSSQTIASYRRTARQHIIPALGNKRLDRLTISDVRRWINRLRKAKDDRTAQDAWAILAVVLDLPAAPARDV